MAQAERQGCGTGSVCACAAAPAPIDPSWPTAAPAAGDAEWPAVAGAPAAPVPVARVNGVPLHEPGQPPDLATLRQRACTELLRQAAQRAGLLAVGDLPATDGAISEAASAAIESLLARELAVPDPSDEACRRHHDAHLARYVTGARVQARHVLFAVTPGVDVVALRQRAEQVLLDLRCHGDDAAAADAAFADAARQWSNCPSAAQGGELGWLAPADCAPEFARELFEGEEVGVLPRLVHSRFGLHVVEVKARERGTPRPYEEVRAAVAQALRQQTYVTALRQYLALLAGEAALDGVDLAAADTPLVQ